MAKSNQTLEKKLAETLAETAALRKRIQAIRAKEDALRAQISSFKRGIEEINKWESKANALESQVTNLRSQLARVNENLVETRKHEARLESLCGVRGIRRDSAIPALGGDPDSSQGEHVYDRWKASTGSKKTRLWRAHKAEIRGEGMRRRKGERP
jgi:prefoldin subunit 5